MVLYHYGVMVHGTMPLWSDGTVSLWSDGTVSLWSDGTRYYASME